MKDLSFESFLLCKKASTPVKAITSLLLNALPARSMLMTAVSVKRAAARDCLGGEDEGALLPMLFDLSERMRNFVRRPISSGTSRRPFSSKYSSTSETSWPIPAEATLVQDRAGVGYEKWIHVHVRTVNGNDAIIV